MSQKPYLGAVEFLLFCTMGAKPTGAFYVGLLDGLLGVAGMIIQSSPVDHSRKFPYV